MTIDHEAWLTNPLTKALKQSHQQEIQQWKEKCDAYIGIHDAVVQDNDTALDLLRQAEVEMRYAGWAREVGDNYGRFRVYCAILDFLNPPVRSETEGA